MTATEFYMVTGVIYLAPHVPPVFGIAIGICFIVVGWLVRKKATGETE
jgi:hypothetical protein